LQIAHQKLHGVRLTPSTSLALQFAKVCHSLPSQGSNTDADALHRQRTPSAQWRFEGAPSTRPPAPPRQRSRSPRRDYRDEAPRRERDERETSRRIDERDERDLERGPPRSPRDEPRASRPRDGPAE
jgi:hypothetical protein